MTEAATTADVFADAAALAFGRCGAKAGPPLALAAAEPSPGDTVVVFGLGGAFRGAVALRFDEPAAEQATTALLGRPTAGDAERVDALLEAASIAAGRGAAALARDVAGGAAVWLTPPLLARGANLRLSLTNIRQSTYACALGAGTCSFHFAATPARED